VSLEACLTLNSNVILELLLQADNIFIAAALHFISTSVPKNFPADR
jgi:hypothetical protein